MLGCTGSGPQNAADSHALTLGLGEESADLGALDLSGRIFTADLHTTRFLIAKPQIAPQSCRLTVSDQRKTIKLPVLSYILPEESEYIQVLRCQSSLRLRSVTEGKYLNDIHSRPLEDLVAQMSYTDFWAQAINSGQCSSAHHAFEGHTVYYDTVAKNNTYYLLRACVGADSIRDREIAGNEFCSRVVTRTDVWNQSSDSETDSLDKLEKVAALEVEQQGQYRDLFNTSSQLFDALKECDDVEANRQIAVRRKKALDTLISSGLGAGLGAMTGENLVGSLQRGSGGMGPQIASVLNDLTSDSADFPQSCYKGNRLYRNLVNQIKLYRFTSTNIDLALKESEVKLNCGSP